MKQKKQWFAYLPLDRKGVEAYLNDQAEKGWALAAEQDGMTFRVPFQETNRTDLRYHVTCDAYQGEKLAEIVAEKQVQGWRPVATINHFDIYESMPCQESQTLAQGRSKRLYFYAFRSWLILLLLATALTAIAWANRIALPFQPIWYLSNLGIFPPPHVPSGLQLAASTTCSRLGQKCFSREIGHPNERDAIAQWAASGGWCVAAAGVGRLAAGFGDQSVGILCFAPILSRRHGIRLRATHWGKNRDLLTRAISLILAVVSWGLQLLLFATNPSDSRAEVGTAPGATVSAT